MAMKRGVKVKEHEKLDDASISRVIELLGGDQPITKKAACEILNISYNTTRLTNIINDFNEKADRRKKNFENNRGKPFTDSDIAYIVRGVLIGETVSDLSETLFRSPSQINKIINYIGIPKKDSSYDYVKVAPLPEECIITSAEPREIVWSARYQAAAEIIKNKGKSSHGMSDVYSIYVFQPTEDRRRGGFYADQRIEELGSLQHLAQYVDINKLTQ